MVRRSAFGRRRSRSRIRTGSQSRGMPTVRLGVCQSAPRPHCRTGKRARPQRSTLAQTDGRAPLTAMLERSLCAAPAVAAAAAAAAAAGDERSDDEYDGKASEQASEQASRKQRRHSQSTASQPATYSSVVFTTIVFANAKIATFITYTQIFKYILPTSRQKILSY